MGSPDGHGSSTGEGRKGALLLLRGGRRMEGDGASERASALPSSNALRPDSNLNLGWYRPAAPDGVLRDSGKLDEWTLHEQPDPASEPQPTGERAAIRLDFHAEPAPADLSHSPLGARQPRDEQAGRSEPLSRREAGLGRVEIAKLRRLAAARLGRGARVFRRPLAAGLGAVLALVLVFAVVTALKQSGNRRQDVAQTGSELGASRLGGGFLSTVTLPLDTLSKHEFRVGGPEQSRSGRRAHRWSEAARAHLGPTNHTGALRISTSSHRSTPVSYITATSHSVAQGTSSAGSDSGTTAAAELPAETTPVRQAPAQQTSTQQPVHYQPTAQPAGPAGLGSHVGGNCNPKCS